MGYLYLTPLVTNYKFQDLNFNFSQTCDFVEFICKRDPLLPRMKLNFKKAPLALFEINFIQLKLMHSNTLPYTIVGENLQ